MGDVRSRYRLCAEGKRCGPLLAPAADSQDGTPTDTQSRTKISELSASIQAVLHEDPTGADRVSGRYAARESPLSFQQPRARTTWLPSDQVAGIDGHRPVTAAVGRGLWGRIWKFLPSPAKSWLSGPISHLRAPGHVCSATFLSA